MQRRYSLGIIGWRACRILPRPMRNALISLLPKVAISRPIGGRVKRNWRGIISSGVDWYHSYEFDPFSDFIRNLGLILKKTIVNENNAKIQLSWVTQDLLDWPGVWIVFWMVKSVLFFLSGRCSLHDLQLLKMGLATLLIYWSCTISIICGADVWRWFSLQDLELLKMGETSLPIGCSFQDFRQSFCRCFGAF